MPVSSIKTSPAVGQVGQPVTVLVVGSADYSHELRGYIQTAPSGSGLLTLDTYAAKLKERVDARLSFKNGQFTFTPDVAGRYDLVVYDVTITRPVPHYQGEVLAGESDDELTSAPTYTVSVYVAKDVSFTVGASPNTATLKVKTYADRVAAAADLSADLTVSGASLTPGSTPASRVASVDSDVLTVVDAIAGVTSDLSRDFFLAFGGYTSGTDLVVPTTTLFALTLRWNRHIALDATYDTHGAADTGNTLTSPDATGLVSAITLLNEIRTKYEAHRVLTAGSVHGSADGASGSVVTAPAATDFASAIALWADLWAKLRHHGTTATPVHVANALKPVDGSMREQVETPRTADRLISRSNALKALYTGHIGRLTNAAAHAIADADNVVSNLAAYTSLEGVIQVVNALADSIEHHAQNLKPDGTAAASAYHQSGGSAIADPGAKIPLRAGSAETAHITLCYCLRAMESHMLNSGVHGGAPQWGNFGPDVWPYFARLTKAWASGVSTPSPTIPPNLNVFSSLAELAYGGK